MAIVYLYYMNNAVYPFQTTAGAAPRPGAAELPPQFRSVLCLLSGHLRLKRNRDGSISDCRPQAAYPRPFVPQ